MAHLLNRLFRVEPGEWPKLLSFGLFGLLLQTGLGIGFAAGDAAFLTHVGADKLPIIFILTPAVMILYTGYFSYLLVRFSIDRVVDATLGLLIAGGGVLFALIEIGLPKPFDTGLYYVLKLYLAMWYIGLYTLFWNFTDTYFDIQDAKRLFPLFAAFCALGTTLGALVVSLLADALPMHGFLLIWAGVALATAPVARRLQRRHRRIADSDSDLDADDADWRRQLARVGHVLRTSRYSGALVLTLFVTLLMTNLAEFQYATVLQAGRDEAQLAGLFGRLYAAANVFNLVVCLFVFNRLVTRAGVRNVALILPVTYFAVFAYFFVAGGEMAAIGAFFAYHGVLTSIEYNNQNLLFNATPSDVKRPLRTVVEGLAEPLASLLAGGFLLFAARNADMRELSGLGLLLGALLVGVVMALRHLYPAAMQANMRRGWLNFGDVGAVGGAAGGAVARGGGVADTARAEALARGLAACPDDERPARLAALSQAAGPGDIGLVEPLVDALPTADRTSRRLILEILGTVGDVEAIPQILAAAPRLSPRELRQVESLLAGLGEAAIPRLMQALGAEQASYRARAVAARALAALSDAQFAAQLDRLVEEELTRTRRRLEVAERFESEAHRSPALGLLAAACRDRIGESVDFTLELLALGGRLPDFDLLIVSLHSANPKVRGNAVEAVAAGVDHTTWTRLEPLIHRRAAAKGAEGPLEALLDQTLAQAHGVEACAAAQALRDLAPADGLALRLRPALASTLSPRERETFGLLLGLEATDRPTSVDLVAAVRDVPAFSAASLEAQAALAERATPDPGAAPATRLALPDGRAWWLCKADADDVATRYADLALAMLKAADGRAYAV